MSRRPTHTFVKLHLTPEAYTEIKTKLAEAGYQHAFGSDDEGEWIDMQGIAVTPELANAETPTDACVRRHDENRKD